MPPQITMAPSADVEIGAMPPVSSAFLCSVGDDASKLREQSCRGVANGCSVGACTTFFFSLNAATFLATSRTRARSCEMKI
jgi:hypothetical protein